MKMHSLKVAAFALAGLLLSGSLSVNLSAAQDSSSQVEKAGKKKTRPRTVSDATKQKTGERLEPDDQSAPPRSGMSAEMQANRRETLSEEEAAVVPYYNNFMATYRLGPEDVISITVFNLERYSKAGITVPPDARISHPLIPEGIFVGGKTTEQVAAEITQKFDEYIIDPKVTVSLDKAQSAVYWVVGDVGQPGIRPMTRRLSVTEALAMSGGVLDTGDKKKVLVMRRRADGYPQQTIINVAAIEKGKLPDNFFLNPGDQVIVPGNRMKSVDRLLKLIPVISFFRIFTGGF